MPGSLSLGQKTMQQISGKPGIDKQYSNILPC